MADDREVLREVWQGRVPVAFTLSADDVETVAQPDPCYLMVPRQSYFPALSDKLRKHFSKYLTSPERLQQQQQQQDVWLDFDGVPLKWHLPVGVLYDQLIASAANTVASAAAAAGPDDLAGAGLPWNLTVHFSHFPEGLVLRLDSKEALESHFMSSIKEADQIKHGGRVMSTMQKKDQNQLWQGLQNDKFDQFWAVNRKLMEPISDSNDGCFRHIPIRLYQGDKPMYQRLIRPTSKTVDSKARSSSVSEGQDPTVVASDDGGDLKDTGGAAEETDSLAGGSAKKQQAQKRRSTFKDLLDEMVPGWSELEGFNVITQGINPDLDTPLQWMSEHLSYPDNFLHIVCAK